MLSIQEIAKELNIPKSFLIKEGSRITLQMEFISCLIEKPFTGKLDNLDNTISYSVEIRINDFNHCINSFLTELITQVNKTNSYLIEKFVLPKITHQFQIQIINGKNRLPFPLKFIIE